MEDCGGASMTERFWGRVKIILTVLLHQYLWQTLHRCLLIVVKATDDLEGELEYGKWGIDAWR